MCNPRSGTTTRITPESYTNPNLVEQHADRNLFFDAIRYTNKVANFSSFHDRLIPFVEQNRAIRRALESIVEYQCGAELGEGEFRALQDVRRRGTFLLPRFNVLSFWHYFPGVEEIPRCSAFPLWQLVLLRGKEENRR